MKKKLVASLAAAMVLGVAGTSFAAANPFVDVPAKHWAYDSVTKLAQAGLVDGYGDGTYLGDKTISRYEMAQIVAKAMTKTDKADAAQKAEINKLEAEFSDELDKLGVRVAKLEKSASNIKFNGAFRQRTDYTEGNSPTTVHKTRMRLLLTAPIDNTWTFKGRYGQESKAGETNGNAQLDQAYITGKALGLDDVSFGRMPLWLGKGLLMDSSGNWDGLKVTTGNEVKVYAGIARKSYATSDNRSFVFANAAYAVDKKIDLTASYFADQGKKTNDKNNYDVWTVGGTYKVMPNVAITGEYAVNGADVLVDDAKAHWVQVKYKGATAANVGSFGAWVGYIKAENNFDPNNYTTRSGTDTVLGANDVKGLEYGIDYTLFKNAVLTVNYNPYENYAGTADKKFFNAYINYGF